MLQYSTPLTWLSIALLLLLLTGLLLMTGLLLLARLLTDCVAAITDCSTDCADVAANYTADWLCCWLECVADCTAATTDCSADCVAVAIAADCTDDYAAYCIADYAIHCVDFAVFPILLLLLLGFGHSRRCWNQMLEYVPLWLLQLDLF